MNFIDKIEDKINRIEEHLICHYPLAINAIFAVVVLAGLAALWLKIH